MVLWLLDRAKGHSTWIALFSLAGAIGLAFKLEHKELVITAAMAVVSAIAQRLATSQLPNDWWYIFIPGGVAKGAALCFFIRAVEAWRPRQGQRLIRRILPPALIAILAYILDWMRKRGLWGR